tara:strand:- start:1126 stop:1680 length:555 start_codon:yes stop_codon:yes gene_type:complete
MKTTTDKFHEFQPFPKMARLSREIIISEKIDGTNAQIFITEDGDVIAGSRNRWLVSPEDNYGFRKWVEGNKEDLLQLGPGRHFGEWWGLGIQRGYDMKEKVFSLFNASRWGAVESPPSCCRVVPVLFQGEFHTETVEACIEALEIGGSTAAPGYFQPEGVIVYHVAGNVGFKKTLESDEPKGAR